MMSRPALRIVRSAPDVDVIELVGDHDMASAPELAALIQPALAERRGIVVDLSEVTFIDSAVIHVLYKTDSALADQGKQLAMQINTASIVMRALEVSELTTKVPRASQRDEAIAIASAPRTGGA